MPIAQGYIGRSPGDSSVVIARQTFSPTGIQTDFTFASGYEVGYLDLYLNGARLIEGQDFTATDGSVVGLTSYAQSGDVLELVAYKAFNAGNVTNALGNFSVAGTLTVGGKVKVDNDFEVTGVSTFTGPSLISVNSSSNALRITQTGSGNVFLAEDQTNPDGSPFVITGIGSVGIGVTNPGRLMSIMDSDGPVLELGTNASGENPSIFLHEGTTGSTVNGGGLVYDAVVNRLNIVCGDAIKTTRMTINRSDGNIGIGSTSPGRLLDIYSPATATGGVRIRNGGGAPDLELVGNQGNVYARFSEEGGTDPGRLELFNSGESLIRLATNATTYFTGGDVGIGTNDPTARLHIDHAGTNTPTTAITVESRVLTTGGGSGIFLKSSSNTTVNRYGTRIHTIRESSDNGASTLVILNEDSTASGLKEALRITSNGLIGIGTDSPIDLLHITASSGDARIVIQGQSGSDAEVKFYEGGTNPYTIGHDAASDEFRIGSTNVDTSVKFRINAAGDATFTGVATAIQWDATSDITLKENIEIINEPITKLSQLKGVTFDWKFGGHSVGVIAQDVEKVLPTAVGGSKDQKTVNYNAIIGLLVESVKDQQKQIEELKSLLDK